MSSLVWVLEYAGQAIIRAVIEMTVLLIVTGIIISVILARVEQ